MIALVLLHILLPGAVAAVAFVLLPLRREGRWRITMIGAAVAGEIAAAYFSAPSGLPHTSCDDCPRIAGRYLDPLSVGALAIVVAVSTAAGSYGGKRVRPRLIAWKSR
jgi:hypothetical protein